MFNINFADDWSQTVDLWYCKQPLYQLSHNRMCKWEAKGESILKLNNVNLLLLFF